MTSISCDCLVCDKHNLSNVRNRPIRDGPVFVHAINDPSGMRTEKSNPSHTGSIFHARTPKAAVTADPADQDSVSEVPNLALTEIFY